MRGAGRTSADDGGDGGEDAEDAEDEEDDERGEELETDEEVDEADYVEPHIEVPGIPYMAADEHGPPTPSRPRRGSV